MTPDEYENVVAGIVSGICQSAPELGDLQLGVGRANRLLGASGYKHQIDVSLSGGQNIYLIECKRWEAKIGVDEVMVLAARAADIVQTNSSVALQAILASKFGATRGAQTLANYFQIQLETVRSAHEFGMRIGKNVKVGMADSFRLGDLLRCTVVSADAQAEG